jgi:hypothetical protein
MFSRYGFSRRYILLAGFIASSFVIASPEARAEKTYQFHLTKGHGTQLCDAYLQRLNVTVYDDPPIAVALKPPQHPVSSCSTGSIL